MPATQKKDRKKHKTASDGGAMTRSSAQQGIDAKWTFLTNHAHVLAILTSHSEMVLREVAIVVGITERAVQRIIQDLEEGGFIERERVGRRNRYRVHLDVPLRHPIEAHHTIGDLLELVAPESLPQTG